MKTTIKIASGRYYKYMNLESISADTVRVSFPYDPFLVAEVKQMEGARYDPDTKTWTIRKSQRNKFAIDFLSGNNPYKIYDAPLVEFKTSRPAYSHQLNMVQCTLIRKQLILAAEMGTGKTLAAIEVMEASGIKNWYWVGPKSALTAVEMEFLKWESKIWPKLFTYDSLKKVVATGSPPPQAIVFDEAQKLKSPNTQRTQAARYLADKMREMYGKDAYIILMSGSPAPNSPVDWWSLAEVCRPGFLKEGSYEKEKRRLGLIVQKDSLAGGSYPELITWYDNPNKCKLCGKLEADAEHDKIYSMNDFHHFTPSENEIAKLYERLKGLVVIHFKKDCLKELPEKIYRIIECEPSQATLNAAKLIVASAKNVVTANMLLRELSDGFQYKNLETDEKITCSGCCGQGTLSHPVLKEWKCANCGIEGEGEFILCPKCEFEIKEENKIYEQQERECFLCSGEGTIFKTERQTIQTETPKEQVLLDLLEEHEDIGRLAIYAGFTGSVDRCKDIALRAGWKTIRLDGRGWDASFGTTSASVMLKEFQKLNKKDHISKLAFIAQPEAGGLGLTLTASPTIFYYSNSFKPEARIQSEDRIHRPGMDLNKGANIIDVFHLPSDKKVLDSLKTKKKLQDMSLGELQEVFAITEKKDRIL